MEIQDLNKKYDEMKEKFLAEQDEIKNNTDNVV